MDEGTAGARLYPRMRGADAREAVPFSSWYPLPPRKRG